TAAPAVGADRPAPPDPALTEPGPTGPLPRIGDDGRTPWRAYARPFDPSERRPRIAVIVSWLGLSRAATETAIQNLPAGVTLAFSPYADDLDTWLARARAAGHETLLNLPMEPVGYPVQDPGPNTLLTGLPADENRARLQWLLSRVSGYVGVINHMGSRFTTTPDSLRPVLDEVRVRGLLFVDSRAAADSAVGQVSRVIGLPYVVNDRNIDHQATRDAIDAQLAEIEQIAARTGQAVAVGLHFPVTLERLALWLPTLEAKGFVLAPVSTMLENPEVASAAPAP
ncbi:MAG: divergent polysaccharide deacetylase family protein, partial [Alphaproteobacteria bacterium]